MSTIINPHRFAPPWTPADVTSAALKFWLEAGPDCEEADGDPCEDADKIKNWLDKSAAGNDFTRTDTFRPTYQADGGSAYLNQPVITHNGSNYGVLDGPDLSSMTAGEVFILGHMAADPPSVGRAFYGRFGSGTSANNTVWWTDGKVYDGFGRATRGGSFNPTPAMTSPRIYNAWSASGDWASRIDDSTLASTATNTVSFTNACQLGFMSPYNLNGTIRAIILFDAKLSGADRASMHTYLDDMRA